MAQGMSESKKARDMAKRAEKWSPENVAKLFAEAEAKKVRSRPDSTVQTDPGDNSKYLAHEMQVASFPVTDMSDPQAVSETMVNYFSLCQQNDMKPSWPGLALALKTDRSNLSAYVSGARGKGENASQVVDVLKMARTIMDGLMNDYMANGKVNPVAGIFLMKNHHGYQNETEVVVKPTNPLGEGQTEEELKQKYIDSVQIVAFEDENGAN